MTQNSSFQIIHTPYGIEHPYQQEPYERFPRQPLDNLPVSIGILILHSPVTPEKVTVEWQVDQQGSIHSTTATIIETTQEKSLWRADLPAFSIGQNIQYHIIAEYKSVIEKSETFEFITCGWRQVGSLEKYRMRSDGISIRFAATECLPHTQMNISWNQKDHLLVSFEIPDNKTFSNEIWKTIPSIHPSQLSIDLQQIRIEIDPTSFVINIFHTDKSLATQISSLPFCKTDCMGGYTECRFTFSSSETEGFYGFGERFNAIDQRGNSPDILVYEQYKNQGIKTYLPIPFFISSNGYAFRINDPVIARFDMCKSEQNSWIVEMESNRDGKICFELWVHYKPLDNLRAYLKSTTMPKLPPDWVFGPWMSSNEWNSQAEVLKQVDLTKNYDIPATVLVIEAWSDEATFYIWNGAKYKPKQGGESFSYDDFEFSPDGLWPNPKAMIDELHTRGIRIVLWQIPTLKKMEEAHSQRDLDESYMLEKGYHLKYSDGRPYLVRPIWFHGSLLLDASNPQALDWWLNKRAYLLDDLGIDGFKTDGGEHLWGKEVVFHNGMHGHEGMNQYPDLYVGAYHQFTTQHRNGDAVTFSRAGFGNAQAFPCHWAGDENSTWNAYRSSIKAGINAGLSGVIFWAWDIAGFSKELPSAELYLRATAMSTFCPIMQYHSEFHNHDIPSYDRTPWNIAEQSGSQEVIDVYRKFSQLRMRLIPYIKEEAAWCSLNGEPLMRAMFLDWPDDPITWTLDDQYMFGRDLLIAPIVFEGQQTRKVYLPAGTWKDVWGETTYSGNCWLEVQTSINTIPVYQRMEIENKLLHSVFIEEF